MIEQGRKGIFFFLFDENAILIDYDDRFSQYCSIDKKEVLGMNLSNFFSFPLHDKSCDTIIEEMRCGKPIVVEKVFIKPRQEACIFSLYGFKHCNHFLIILHDLSKGAVNEIDLLQKEHSYRLEIEGLITTINSKFINLGKDEIEKEIYEAVGKIGAFVGADLSYIFLFSEDGKTMLNIHEWHAEQKSLEKVMLSGLESSNFPWWIHSLEHFKNIYIPDVDLLPPEARTETENLHAEYVKSIMVVPMLQTGRLKGFLGFASVKAPRNWRVEDISLLRMMGEIFINALERVKTEKQLNISEKTLMVLNKELERRVEERTIELKNAQEKLLRQEKLATIGKIVGGISHELRNPLSLITNSIYYLDMKLLNLDVKYKKYLSSIRNEAERMSAIITDLLDFVRTRPPILGETNIHQIIKLILTSMNVPDNVKIYLDFKSPSLIIKADASQIRQVFNNIIENAIQSMKAGGSLHIDTIEKEGLVDIIFKDTGIGIPKENMSSLFEPLFTTKVKGIGLGLTVVKDIIDIHNGKIKIESEVGTGTVVTISLPKLS
jgi:signal transduction histidine kinase